MTEHTYTYPRPALTSDIIALRWRHHKLETLLIRRASDPSKGELALPGGFVDQGETPKAAAVRECFEETSVHIDEAHLIEVGCFGAPDRDPRGWTVSITFVALLPSTVEAVALDDAKEVLWLPWCDLVELKHKLAFDHQQMILSAHKVLRQRSLTSSELLALLDAPFRSRHVRFLYRQLWGDQIKPRPFKAWLRQVDLVERVGKAVFKSKTHLRLPWR